MQSIKFTILLPPTGQKRARNRAVQTPGGKSFSMTYKDGDQRQEEEKLITLAYEQRPPAPLDGPLLFGLKAFRPIPGGWSKKKTAQALAGEIRPTTKPDLDNLLKNIKDVLKGVFWIDDKQVVEYLPGTGKYYGEPARWEVEIQRFVCQETKSIPLAGNIYPNRETYHPELW